MFARVHSAQEEGWRPDGAAIATHTNFFSAQREQEGMITPRDSMVVTSRLRRSDEEYLIGGIRNDEGHQIENRNATPLIDDLEMRDIFEDEDEKEGDGVTDLISAAVELLGRDMSRLVVEVREALEPVEPWGEG